MIKTKVAFLEGRLLSSQSEQSEKFSQSEQSEKFSKALIGWKKAGPPKKPLLLWSCKQAIYEKDSFFPKCKPIDCADSSRHDLLDTTFLTRSFSTLPMQDCRLLSLFYLFQFIHICGNVLLLWYSLKETKYFVNLKTTPSTFGKPIGGWRINNKELKSKWDYAAIKK